MNTERLISLKTVRLAKEKGFDMNNIPYRDSKTSEIVLNWKERLEYFATAKNANLIKIPTQSLLQKWLRDEHNMDIEIYMHHEMGVKEYAYLILSLEGKQILWKSAKSGRYNSYEDALETGLKESIKLLD